MILRKIKDIDPIDVGKPFGMPEGSMIIQWIFHSQVGDEKYHHQFAVRKYTLKPVDPSAIPFHNHKYVQSLTVLSGRIKCESPSGIVEAGPGDSVCFYENEPHKASPIEEGKTEVLCVIDCLNGEENCFPVEPRSIETK